jgi:hypothetical protein
MHNVVSVTDDKMALIMCEEQMTSDLPSCFFSCPRPDWFLEIYLPAHYVQGFGVRVRVSVS